MKESTKQAKKKTNRDKLIQSLKENDFDYLCQKLTCYACEYCDDYDRCNKCSTCSKGMELWLDREVSDE